MNLRDLIDKLVRMENGSNMHLPVYFMNDQGESFLVTSGAAVTVNLGENEIGELLDLKLYERYVRLS